MLCKLQNVKKLCLRAGFLSLLFYHVAVIVWAPVAQAQAPGSEQTDGKISGTVLLKANHRPASQVAVKLKSHAVGIFRSILTDFDGHFEVKSLPPSTISGSMSRGTTRQKPVHSLMALPRSLCFI